HMWSKLILTHHWPSTFCSMEHCHSKFDYWTLHGLWVMKKCNIVPSETYYTFDLIERNIFNFYNVKPKIQCIHPKEGNVQILGQIEICFNSDFQLEDCEHSETDTVNLNVKGAGFSVCDNATPVYYPSLKGKSLM
ncbi:unnamed protein product, partial [Coregonus sp. 'balchen']